MADPAARIDQFRQMAEADPSNELGHFSLGRALADAGRHGEAVESYDRALAINPNLGKAYHLKAQSLLAQDQRDAAIDALTTGVTVAHERGEVLPKNDMLSMLRDLGAPEPELASSASAVEQVGEGQVLDRRTGRVGRRLPKPPLRGPLGQAIYDNVSAESWAEWIGMGTKVINELRLPMSDPQAQKMFDQHMVEFLNLKDVVDA